jgi:hypothetical protein
MAVGLVGVDAQPSVKRCNTFFAQFYQLFIFKNKK